MNTIEKIKYTKTGFDFEKMIYGAKENITIISDGHVQIRRYPAGERKCSWHKDIFIEENEYEKLCNQIENCINAADSLDDWCDDCDAVLYLSRSFGREESLPRGFGNSEMRIKNIMDEFYSRYIEKE
ncbi:MAG: hypothetical protein ACI4GW_08770 [Lachnospiraceae bacterium]